MTYGLNCFIIINLRNDDFITFGMFLNTVWKRNIVLSAYDTWSI